MGKSITQREWVLSILNKEGKITRNMCLKNYISRLGAIINDLKKEGYEFQGKYIKVKTFFGESKDYEYTLIK
jgi:hypothetical protein